MEKDKFLVISIFSPFSTMFSKVFLVRLLETGDCVVCNPLPNDKILDLSNLKAFADGKLDFTKMAISLCDKVENTVGKGEKF